MKKFLVFIMSCSLFGSGVLGAVEPGEASVFGKNRALYGEYQAVCELLRGRTDSAQLAERFESVCACLCTQESCPSDFTEQMKVIVRALARGGERDSADRAAVEAFIQHARAGRFAWKKAVLVVAGLVATALLAKKLRDRKEVAVVPAKSDPIGTALGAHVAASGVESQVAISGLEPYVVTPEIIAKETQRVQELEQMLEAARERKSAVARKNGIVPLFTEQQREYATEKIVGFIQKHKPSYDGARERQQNQLRAFVSAPHAQGTKFEKMADIIGQIPEISCESFKRDQAEAALFLRERSAYDSLWVETSIFEVTLPKFSTEAKHYFIDNTLALEQRLIAEFNKFGVASSLKPTDLKRKYNYSNDGIPVDHVFVIKFTPHRAVDGKSSVVLKIPNPYAYYSNQQRYLSGPYEGENHSGFRNVERVLIAEKIRQAGEGVLSVAEKHIALRSGSSLGGPINDATAIVMSDCLSFQSKTPINRDSILCTGKEIDQLLAAVAVISPEDWHDGNLVQASSDAGRLYLLDTEKTYARRKDFVYNRVGSIINFFGRKNRKKVALHLLSSESPLATDSVKYAVYEEVMMHDFWKQFSDDEMQRIKNVAASVFFSSLAEERLDYKRRLLSQENFNRYVDTRVESRLRSAKELFPEEKPRVLFERMCIANPVIRREKDAYDKFFTDQGYLPAAKV